MPKKKSSNNHLPLPPEEILKDYRLAYQSRQASLVGRREVLSGKAKFGIFGDGKEIPQLAMARAARYLNFDLFANYVYDLPLSHPASASFTGMDVILYSIQ
jgi:hypothetical protein